MLRFYRLSPLWGLALPLIGVFYAAFTLDSAIQHWAGKGGMWKGRAQAARMRGTGMSGVAELQSGKGHRDENFPVASFLIAPQHRAAGAGLLQFRARRRRCRRPSPPPRRTKSCACWNRCAPAWWAKAMRCRKACALRDVLAERGLSPVHALDLLEAFRRDCTKLRYRDWDDLIDYCRYSRHAGGPLCAGCAWRKPETCGPPMTRSAPRCR